MVILVGLGRSNSLVLLVLFTPVRGRSLQLPPFYVVPRRELQAPTGYKWLHNKFPILKNVEEILHLFYSELVF